MDERARNHTQPVEEWVNSEARDSAEAARQQLDAAKRDVMDYAARTTEYVQEGIDQAREYAEGTLRRARDTVAEFRRRGERTVRHDVPSYVREQPMTALLIAAGIGPIVGWLGAARR
jgi:ElaB/YqjD/DUF883 family membrane-anchored ribosome-binding protein